jgi:hypothetical protein
MREKIIRNSPPLSHALCLVVNPPNRTNFALRPTARPWSKDFQQVHRMKLGPHRDGERAARQPLLDRTLHCSHIHAEATIERTWL